MLCRRSAWVGLHACVRVALCACVCVCVCVYTYLHIHIFIYSAGVVDVIGCVGGRSGTCLRVRLLHSVGVK